MTTNAWLAIIAISSLVQLALVIGLLIGAVRFQRRAEHALAEVKSEVHDAVDRVRRADDAVRHVMQRAGMPPVRSVQRGVAARVAGSRPRQCRARRCVGAVRP